MCYGNRNVCFRNIVECFPHKVMKSIVGTFSLGEFGIHYSKRKRDNIDDFGRWMMFVSLVFSIVYPVLPFFRYIFVAFLAFAFLCVLGQTTRVTDQVNVVKKKLVLIGVYAMFLVGVFAGLGLLDGNALDPYIKQVLPSIIDKEYMNPYFYFTSPIVAVYLLQAIIFMIALYYQWAQFMYMRLEDTYKAAWMITWILKIILCCTILFTFSYNGFDAIEQIYNIKEQTEA